jgi:hypothetical protein
MALVRRERLAVVPGTFAIDAIIRFLLSVPWTNRGPPVVAPPNVSNAFFGGNGYGEKQPMCRGEGVAIIELLGNCVEPFDIDAEPFDIDVQSLDIDAKLFDIDVQQFDINVKRLYIYVELLDIILGVGGVSADTESSDLASLVESPERGAVVVDLLRVPPAGKVHRSKDDIRSAVDRGQDCLGQLGRIGLRRGRSRRADLREPLLDLLLDRRALPIQLGQTIAKLAEIGRRFEHSFGRGQCIAHPGRIDIISWQ